VMVEKVEGPTVITAPTDMVELVVTLLEFLKEKTGFTEFA